MKHYDPKEFASDASPSGSAHTMERSFRLWPRVLAGLALVLLLVIGCGGWAAMARLEGAVVAAGTVKVDQNLKEVQHRDGGIVKTLAIRQGDLVKEGQVLATLDDVQIKAELLIVRSQLGEAMGRQARLIGERDNLRSIEFPAELERVSSAADFVITERAACLRATSWAGIARRSSSSSASTRPWRKSGEWRRDSLPRRKRSNWWGRARQAGFSLREEDRGVHPSLLRAP